MKMRKQNSLKRVPRNMFSIGFPKTSQGLTLAARLLPTCARIFFQKAQKDFKKKRFCDESFGFEKS